MLLALDPGTVATGYVVLTDAWTVAETGHVQNVVVLESVIPNHRGPVVCEAVKAMGMPVGDETFTTVFWIGRFCERAQLVGLPFAQVTRRDVKLHLCGNAQAKDPHVRRALLDHFGPGKEVAVGSKKHPGPLYGIKSHGWSALAVAVTWAATAGPAA